MSYQHQSLSNGRWTELTLMAQLGNVGSEVARTISWQRSPQYGDPKQAFNRALELLSLTIDDPKNTHRLKELCRTYEALNDWFYGDNLFQTDANSWQKYFLSFAIAARNQKQAK